jgi:hypothetical protein
MTEPLRLRVSKEIFPTAVLVEAVARLHALAYGHLDASEPQALLVVPVPVERSRPEVHRQALQTLTDLAMDHWVRTCGQEPRQYSAQAPPPPLDVTLKVVFDSGGLRLSIVANPEVHAPAQVLRALAGLRQFGPVVLESTAPADRLHIRFVWSGATVEESSRVVAEVVRRMQLY